MCNGDGHNVPSIDAGMEGSFAKKKSNMTRAELFGGAMVAELPDGMRDESECYTIPDHQEIYLNEATRDCLIVEVVEHASVSSDSGSGEAICSYYVNDLAQMNEATCREFAYVPSEGCDVAPMLEKRLAESSDRRLRDTTRAHLCSCRLDFSPGHRKEDMERMVTARVYVMVVQIPACEADVVISLKSSSDAPVSATREDWQRVVDSFDVCDFGLFGG